jgi:hypothetical protein
MCAAPHTAQLPQRAMLLWAGAAAG